jgi:hypothetical protein
MRTLLALTASAIMAGSAIAGAAQATPMSAPSIAPVFSAVYTPADRPLLQDAQYFYSGRNYCWYDDGWNGPGYYWCGYGARRGFGWGGVFGWNGWNWGHGGHGYRGAGFAVQRQHFSSGGHFRGGFQGGGGRLGGGHTGGGHSGGGHGGGHGDHHHRATSSHSRGILP